MSGQVESKFDCNMGWFLHDGQKITQLMVFPSNHPHFPIEPKGMKAVLTGHSLFQSGLCGKYQKCDGINDAAETNAYWSFSQISRTRNCSCNKSSRLWGIYVSFCSNFIVNSILLSSLGGLWRNTCVTTVITHS